MKLPIIDYRSHDAPDQFIKSIRETGFAVLTNTFVGKPEFDEVYSDFRAFFANEDQKKAMMFNPETHAGYFPFKSEKAKDSSIMDLKEFFHYFPNAFTRNNGRTEGQQNPSGAATDELCFALEDIAKEILDWLQTAYLNSLVPDELDSEQYKMRCKSWSQAVDNSKNTLFRVLHYPPLSGGEEPGAVRSAAHEDINFITLLPASAQPGLQVKDLNGNWHDVPTDSNSIVVNIGDMLQLLSEGYYPSTTHRVVNPTGPNVSRYSMPLFVHPHPETQLSQTKTAAQYLDERLREIGLK